MCSTAEGPCPQRVALSIRRPGARRAAAGVYADPNHPLCERTIDENGVIRGVDPVPFERGAGCGTPGMSANAWKINGKIAPKDKSIFINFDEKDGSGEAFDGVYDKKRNGASPLSISPIRPRHTGVIVLYESS